MHLANTITHIQHAVNTNVRLHHLKNDINEQQIINSFIITVLICSKIECKILRYPYYTVNNTFFNGMGEALVS